MTDIDSFIRSQKEKLNQERTNSKQGYYKVNIKSPLTNNIMNNRMIFYTTDISIY